MRLLLDSHAVYWFLRGDARLSARARKAVADSHNDAFVSAATGYELALKARRGRLDLRIVKEMGAMLRAARLTVLPISLAHALDAGDLPEPHRDPFDRVLMAQARAGRLTVVTVDPVFADYGVPTLW
ncbi:MAG: type II toxin-antitoxin system VapC family toxin [Parvularculaceae bacterium]|nr:type II toxin-antitoxin system VapC family toxin [Parvularculaceae bacterium]